MGVPLGRRGRACCCCRCSSSCLPSLLLLLLLPHPSAFNRPDHTNGAGDNNGSNAAPLLATLHAAYMRRHTHLLLPMPNRAPACQLPAHMHQV